MRKKAEHLSELKKVNLEARSPLGQIPLDRLLRKHVHFIDGLRAAGFTWDQIARGLPSWKKKNGSSLSADQLRGAFSRIRKKMGDKLERERRPPAPPSTPPDMVEVPADVKSVRRLPHPPASGLRPETMSLLEKTRKTRDL